LLQWIQTDVINENRLDAVALYHFHVTDSVDNALNLIQTGPRKAG